MKTYPILSHNNFDNFYCEMLDELNSSRFDQTFYTI